MTISPLEQAWNKRRQTRELVVGSLTAIQLDAHFTTIASKEFQRQVLRFLALRWPKPYSARLLSAALMVSETKARRALRSLWKAGALNRSPRGEYLLGEQVLSVENVEPKRAQAHEATRSPCNAGRDKATARIERLKEYQAKHRLHCMLASTKEELDMLVCVRLVLAADDKIISTLSIEDCVTLLGCSEVEAAEIHEDVFVRNRDQYNPDWARDQLFGMLGNLAP